jgi:hypothetical protein
MVSEVGEAMTTDAPERVRPTTAITATPITQESQPSLRSSGEARETLSEHLRLMLGEKPNVPWGTTLAWSEGGIARIPSYGGHVIRVSDEKGEIGPMVMSLAKSRGFTGEPTMDSCSWTHHYTQISPDAHVGETGAFEAIKPENRQIITYMGEVSGEYEVYQNEVMPGVWLIRAVYSGEKIGDEGVYRSGAYTAEKAAKYGLRKPEPSKPKVVWQIYRPGVAEHGDAADQRGKGASQKPEKTAVPLPPPRNGWGRKSESSAVGTFGGGR